MDIVATEKEAALVWVAWQIVSITHIAGSAPQDAAPEQRAQALIEAFGKIYRDLCEEINPSQK